MTMSIGGTSGLVFPDSSTQNTAATGFGFKNRIINGAMMIDQRNAGASVTPASGAYTLDRWVYNASQASKVSIQQNAGSVTPPTGFTKYLGVTSLSAYTVGSGELFVVSQAIEGLNIADFGWGTANAASITISFRVYSSLTGTFGGALRNGDGSRSYPFSYTISAANTWTTISFTVAGDTTGTWYTDTNQGVKISFGLGVGSTYSTTAGAWAAGNYLSATGATSVVGTNGATFYITGVQLEKGSTATSFDYRPYGTELALCQRYYEKSYNIDTAPGAASTYAGNSLTIAYGAGVNRPVWTMQFNVCKRATPTVTLYSPHSGASGKVGGPSGSDYTGTQNDPGMHGFSAYQNQVTSTSNGDYYLHWVASAEL